jgi:hypothetical protein
MDGMDAARDLYLAAADASRAGLEREIQSLRELTESQHQAMTIDTHARAEELATTVALRAEALAARTESLADGVQLQMDQRFAVTAEDIRLLQEQLDRRLGVTESSLNANVATAREREDIIHQDLDRRIETSRRESDTTAAQVDQRFSGLKELLNQRFDAEAEARRTALVTATEAVNAALAAAETAVNKAETATEKRFEGVNEFRQTLTDQAAAFPTRAEVSSLIEVVRVSAERNTEALKDIELRFTSRLDTMAGKDTGAKESRSESRLDTGQVLQLLALLVVAVSVIVTILLHK